MFKFIALFLIGSLVGLFILMGMKNKYQRELIMAGKCEATAEALYQPPPTYVKSGEIMVPIANAPYMRHYWECEEGQKFWRRK